MGLTITIIGFAIWSDLPKTQSLNHAIKTCPMVCLFLSIFNHCLFFMLSLAYSFFFFFFFWKIPPLQGDLFIHTLLRAFYLLGIPMAINFVLFYLHFAVLTQAGPGAAFVSHAFQSSLQVRSSFSTLSDQ